MCQVQGGDPKLGTGRIGENDVRLSFWIIDDYRWYMVLLRLVDSTLYKFTLCPLLTSLCSTGGLVVVLRLPQLRWRQMAWILAERVRKRMDIWPFSHVKLPFCLPMIAKWNRWKMRCLKPNWIFIFHCSNSYQSPFAPFFGVPNLLWLAT